MKMMIHQYFRQHPTLKDTMMIDIHSPYVRLKQKEG